ncbi:competence/damage-inducible protein A [Parvularcula maris]|uniref:Molybdopterin-binding protein n=1 Tax=Parvularcula maris TaxID=2965077 RepID=A0A9X2L767_9PROT|nr:molybdopterin-binding protein [Parvularcula maris]MCQ8184311.1 molybdopterin-binding protein [Parvularcula maris]
MKKNPQTAACLLIGDELLSGRTRDANANTLAKALYAKGIELIEVRIVPDEHKTIGNALIDLKVKADIVITSGGIGPTHDDITADAVSAALGRKTVEHDGAMKILKAHYAAKDEEVTDARRRMARMPKDAELIANSVSGAPGFRVENVYVLAGVPAIFDAMLEEVLAAVPDGEPETVYHVTGEAKESDLADGLRDLETALKGLKIGSYPGPTGKGGPLTIVCRSRSASVCEQAALAVKALFTAQGKEAEIGQGDRPA